MLLPVEPTMWIAAVLFQTDLANSTIPVDFKYPSTVLDRVSFATGEIS